MFLTLVLPDPVRNIERPLLDLKTIKFIWIVPKFSLVIDCC